MLFVVVTVFSNEVVTVECVLVDRGSDDYVGNNQVWDFSAVSVLDGNGRLVTDLSGNVVHTALRI